MCLVLDTLSRLALTVAAAHLLCLSSLLRRLLFDWLHVDIGMRTLATDGMGGTSEQRKYPRRVGSSV